MHPSRVLRPPSVRLFGAKVRAGWERASRPLRLLGRALACVLGVWVLWIVVAQVLLATPLLRALLNAESPAIHLEYRWAWSLWPGTVHLRGFVLTSQDRKVQWQLEIDKVATSIALTDLPRRIFHATRIRADGVSFALRRRIPKPQVTPERLVGIPPIRGFPDTPLADEGPDYDVPDWDYHLWSVWLQDTDATSVRQIWVDRVRLEGGAHVAGAFYLKPIRRVLLDPVVLEGTALAFADGPARIAGDLNLALRLKLGPFDPRGMRPETFLRAMDVDAQGTARLEGLEGFEHLFSGERLSGGSGPVRFAVHLQAGQLVPPSELSADLSRIRVRRGTMSATAERLSLDLAAPAGPPPQSASARIDLRGIGGPGTRIASVAAELVGGPQDLAALMPPRRARVDIRGGEIEDARVLAEALGLEGRVKEGIGDFSAHLDGPWDGLAGELGLSLSGLRGKAASATLLGDLEVKVKVRALDPGRGVDLSGTRVDVDSARAVLPSGEEDARPGWWARIALPRAQVRFAAKGDQPILDADLQGRCRDARPIVGLYARQADLPAFVRGLFAMDDLKLRGSAIAGRSWIALRNLAADGDHASVHAALRTDRKGPHGAALLTVRGVSAGVEVSPSGKSVHLLGPGAWYAEKVAQLDPGRVVGRLPRARRSAPRRRAARVQTAE